MHGGKLILKPTAVLKWKITSNNLSNIPITITSQFFKMRQTVTAPLGHKPMKRSCFLPDWRLSIQFCLWSLYLIFTEEHITFYKSGGSIGEVINRDTKKCLFSCRFFTLSLNWSNSWRMFNTWLDLHVSFQK